MEPPDANAASSLSVKLAGEHRELARTLADVERALKRQDRSRRSVEQQLANLAEILESHFDHEESGGYMVDALARAPRLSNAAQKLLVEHADVLDDAKKLQILGRSGVESKAWWRQIETDFTSLRARLLAHEHAEDKLLYEAFNRDVGVTD